MKSAPEKNRNGQYYHSLTRNIITTIILVSVIPLLLVTGTIYYQFRVSYHEKVNEHLQELVQKHRQNIDGFLSQKLAEIRFLANRYGYEYLKNEGNLEETLAALQKDYGPSFVDLGVIHASGEQVAYAGPFKLGKAMYHRADWFQVAMSRKYYISDVFLGLRGMPHFIIAVRNTRAGEPWILRATIDFVTFNTLVENVRIGKTGFALILNRKGELQTGPITKPQNDIIPSRENYQALLTRTAEAKLGTCTTILADKNGNPNLYVAASLKSGDWFLIYQQKAEDAFEDLGRSLRISISMVVLGTLAIIIMALTLSKRFVRRVTKTDQEKQMMNERMVETGKLASIGELAAGVAHEINNPVAIMVEEAGWMEDLLEEEDPGALQNLDEFRRALEQIRNQGKRCKEITHKLLSFARKTDSKIQPVDINDLIEEMVAISAQRAKYSMVELSVDLDPDLSTLELSLSEMQQVILNLINNALDAMEKEGGKLKITTEKTDSLLRIEISDTGPGIPALILPRIFDPFFTTKSVGKGTGLGLSICYGIIEKMGGTINVASRPGEGSVFTIELPVNLPINHPASNTRP
jgi:two-component system NtrC family sensor kinase